MKKKIFVLSFLSLTIFFAGCSATLTPQERIHNFELVKKALIEQDKYKEAQKVQRTIDKIKKENGIPVNDTGNKKTAEKEIKDKNIKEPAARKTQPAKTPADRNSVIPKKNKTIVKTKKTGRKKNVKKAKRKPKKRQLLFKIYSIKTKSLKFKELKENNEKKLDVLKEIKK